MTLSKFIETKLYLYEKDKLLDGVIYLLPIVCGCIAGKVSNDNQCWASIPGIHVLPYGTTFMLGDICHLQ
nr:MAG TPA: hypothetical protein [Siphoviridae sp. ctDlU28]